MKNRLNFPGKKGKKGQNNQPTPEQQQQMVEKARQAIVMHAQGLMPLINPGCSIQVNIQTGKIITPGQVNGNLGRQDIIVLSRPVATETFDVQKTA